MPQRVPQCKRNRNVTFNHHDYVEQLQAEARSHACAQVCSQMCTSQTTGTASITEIAHHALRPQARAEH